MSDRLSYPTLLDRMIDIAREQAKTETDLAVIHAYEAGRRFTVPKSLQRFFDAAVADARLKNLAADPERELFERLQVKFAPLLRVEDRL